MATPPNDGNRPRVSGRYTQGSDLINAPSAPRPDPPSSVESFYQSYQPEPSFTAPPIPFPSPRLPDGSLPSLPGSQHTFFPNFPRYVSPLVDVTALNNTNGAFTGGSTAGNTNNSGSRPNNTSGNGNPNTPASDLLQLQQHANGGPRFGDLQSFTAAPLRSLSSAPTFDFSAFTTLSQQQRHDEEQRELDHLQRELDAHRERERNQLQQHQQQQEQRQLEQQREFERQQLHKQELERHEDFLAAFSAARSHPRPEPDGDNLSRRSHRSRNSSIASRGNEPVPMDAYITTDPKDSLSPNETHEFYNPYSRTDAENDEEAKDHSFTGTPAPALVSKGPSLSSSSAGSFQPGPNPCAVLRKKTATVSPVPSEITMPPSSQPARKPNPTLDAQITKEEAARDLWRQYDLNTVSHLGRVIHLRDKIALEIDFSAESLLHNVQEYRHVQRTYAEAGSPAQNFDTWMFKVKQLRGEQATRHFATNLGKSPSSSDFHSKLAHNYHTLEVYKPNNLAVAFCIVH